MSSYVASSYCSQAHDASYGTHTFGNYGSLPELQQNSYYRDGLDLSGNMAEQASCNSPKQEEMSTSLSIRSNTPPEPPRSQSCFAAVGAPNVHIQNSCNLDGLVLLNQKLHQGTGELFTKPSGKNQKHQSESRVETEANQQQNSAQNSKQPQIYPWMTKLHMSHGKVCLWIFFLAKRAIILNCHSISLSFSFSFTALAFHLATTDQSQEIIK